MLTFWREATCSGVTAGWLTRKLTRGGARWRVVGLYVSIVSRNKFGSNMGSVTSLPPMWSMPDMVTFIAKMWYIGRTQMVVSSYTQFPTDHSQFLCVVTSLMTWKLWWQICASCDVMLLCVSITPFGVPVVPLLYGRTATDSSPGAELGSRLEPL